MACPYDPASRRKNPFLGFAQNIGGVADHSQRGQSPCPPDIRHLEDVRVLQCIGATMSELVGKFLQS